jgi:glycosyltransferase involved in cell wall biosynthesis
LEQIENKAQNTVVSIITIVFNDNENIETTLLSVLNQTYKNIEYIIIDGGSTDGTLDILKRYQSQFSVLVSEKDSGISDAFNKGILIAKGQIIGMINSGDSYEDNAVELIVNYFNLLNCKSSLVFHGNIRMFGNGFEKIYKPKQIESFYRQMPIWHPTTFVTKDIYLKYKYNLSYKIAMDYELFVRLYNNTNIHFIYIPYLISNMSIEGVSNKSAVQGFEEVMKASREHLNIGKKRSFLILWNRVLLLKFLKLFKQR